MLKVVVYGGVILLISWLLVVLLRGRPGFEGTRKAFSQSTQYEIDKNTQIATFAAGCFWCTEAIFQEYPGVIDAIAGYAGGDEKNPTYEQVSSKKTGHREAIRVIYDDAKVSYKTLVELMMKSIDPTDGEGQFADRGFQYTTAVFYHNDYQKQVAQDLFKQIQGQYDQPIMTEIIPYTNFYDAEPFHQDFYKHSAERYAFYKEGSGRTKYFQESGLDAMKKSAVAGDINDSDWESFVKPQESILREQLTATQFRVTQRDGTETPFLNAYRDNKAVGIYVDIVSGEPLFSSKDKYASGTGRPSFVKPIDENMVTLHEDTKLWTPRTEVRSALADSHLGHVFDDGPVEKGGKRWCMNSASMEFVPLDEMDSRGYGSWKWAVE